MMRGCRVMPCCQTVVNWTVLSGFCGLVSDFILGPYGGFVATFWLLSMDAFLRVFVLTAITVLITAYRNVTPYSLVDCYQRSEDYPWRWKQQTVGYRASWVMMIVARSYPNICLEELRKPWESKSKKVTRHGLENQTRKPENRKQ